MITIYHNPKCSKSREALAYLKEQGKEIEIREYLKDTPSKKELQALLKKLNVKATDIIRKGETIYKENYKNKSLSEDEWIDILVEHPILIERPIVIHNQKAAIGRPLENVMALVETN